ncbi:MAG: sulfurtransferase [Candidatus Rokubacteria bacterium]|nr:sulfurtransferase [Candidatus Rokubacteria bacterium]
MNQRRTTGIWIGLVLVLSLASSAFGAEVIVDTAYVAKQKDKAGVVLLDARGGKAYGEGHIPGAINLGGRGAAVVLRDVDARVLPVKTLEKILGEAGISRDQEIIVYGAKGDTGMTVPFWILEYLGAEKVRAYWGGIDDWKAAKQPLATQEQKLPAAKFVAKVRADRYASTEYVKANLKNANVQIVDSRTPKEFAGDDIRALRGGHVPGAILIPFEQNWADPEAAKKLADKKVTGRDGMALKDDKALREIYKGLDPKKEVVAYCQTGTRSTLTYVALRSLGFEKIRNYDDSWIVWGSRPDLPVENASYYDFVKVNAALRRIDDLERQVDELTRKR